MKSLKRMSLSFSWVWRNGNVNIITLLISYGQRVSVDLSTHLHQHLHVLALGNVPLTCGWFLRAWRHTPQAFLEISGQAGHVFARWRHNKVRPQHRELRALLFSNSAWVLLLPAGLRTIKPKKWKRQIKSAIFNACVRFKSQNRDSIINKNASSSFFTTEFTNNAIATISNLQ